MTDPHPLLSLPPRELDAMAECMEPRPSQSPTDFRPWSDYSPRKAWIGELCHGNPATAKWVPRDYSNPDSPRSLLESVESEIERRDLWHEYAAALMALMRPDGDWHVLSDERIAWIAASAPTNVKSAAAVAALKGGSK